MQSFGPLCWIECSGEVKASCVNRELALYPDMLSLRFWCIFQYTWGVDGEITSPKAIWVCKTNIQAAAR